MENIGGFSFNETNQTTRKRRSNRRPRNDIQPDNGNSSLSSSNNGSKGLSDDNIGEKIRNLNQCNSSRVSYTNLTDAETAPNVNSEFRIQESGDDKDIGEDFESNYKDIMKKVKLKVGGVIRTIHTKPPHHATGSRLKQKLISRCIEQENRDEDDSNGLQGIPWKDFSRSGFRVGKDNSSRNKRVPKKRVLNDDDYDDDDDAELRYISKLKLKSAKFNDDEDNDYKGEERESADVAGEDSSREMTVTTRRQALQSADSNASVVEFPHGLPPAPSRKQKDKLSEVEHQLKKAEAAQRRKVQAAKAARESEAEAIRKILGQDSSRKKRENKMKQRQEELAQERNLNAATLSSNTVRWVIRPTGTIVTFSDDIGLPNIFQSTPSSYPPPREKCAGPSCSKPFKYRDSRSKLPLCSLHCYKALQQKTHPEAVY